MKRLAGIARDEHRRAVAVDAALDQRDDATARAQLRAVGYGRDAAAVVVDWRALGGTLPDCVGGCAAKTTAAAPTCNACLGRPTLIAVYGTLRLGHGNWARYLRGRAEHVATTRTAPGYAIGAGGMARLVRLTDGEARRRGCVGFVVVDVYRVSPRVLADLDGLESHPRAWRREPIAVVGGCGDLAAGEHVVEAYVWATPAHVYALEPTGDYEANGGRGWAPPPGLTAQLREQTRHGVRDCPLHRRPCDHVAACATANRCALAITAEVQS